MHIKYFLLTTILIILFTRCSNPTTKNDKNNSTTSNIGITTKDSSNIQDSTTNTQTEISSTQSEITCPKCGHKKMETLPTDVCLLKYTCEKCRAELLPENGDCCVFCTYGTHKCPSMQ